MTDDERDAVLRSLAIGPAYLRDLVSSPVRAAAASNEDAAYEVLLTLEANGLVRRPLDRPRDWAIWTLTERGIAMVDAARRGQS